MPPYSLIFSVLIAFFLGVSGCGKAKGPRTSVTLYVVEKVSTAPVMDGVLEDDCWKNVGALEFVRTLDSGKPRNPTTLRMVYDSTKMYLAFECQDLDAASDVIQFDGPVEEQDCIALLIGAGADSAGYFMIAVAPTGAVHDAYVLNRDNGSAVKILSSWNCEKLLTSVTVYGGGAKPGTEDRFWTLEMAVPFSQIWGVPHVPPVPGDSWRVNICRIDITDGRELSAVAPTGAQDIQRPYAFANIVFGDSLNAGKKSNKPAAGGNRLMASGGRSLRP